MKQLTENSSDTVLGKMMLAFVYDFFVFINFFLKKILYIAIILHIIKYYIFTLDNRTLVSIA